MANQQFIKDRLNSKSLIEDGKDRKNRIVDKIIHKTKSLLFITNSYCNYSSTV